jgi:hypothetical protein
MSTFIGDWHALAILFVAGVIPNQIWRMLGLWFGGGIDDVPGAAFALPEMGEGVDDEDGIGPPLRGDTVDPSLKSAVSVCEMVPPMDCVWLNDPKDVMEN